MEKVHLSKEDAARIIAAQSQHTIALKEVTIAQLQADVVHKTALLIVQDIAHKMGITAPNLQFAEDGQPYFAVDSPVSPDVELRPVSGHVRTVREVYTPVGELANAKSNA